MLLHLAEQRLPPPEQWRRAPIDALATSDRVDDSAVSVLYNRRPTAFAALEALHN
jgi:hypothetical protein